MKIMTFNTQHCLNFKTKKIDYDIMAETINKFNPDIVGLNEMRSSGEEEGFDDQMSILSELTKMKYYYFGKAIEVRGKNPYGNGILSKYPFESIENIMIPDSDEKTGERHYETRCVIKATLENGVTVLVTHFGLNEDEQENAVKTVLSNTKEEKCILMGDFNLRPENEMLNPIREKMIDAESSGLTFPSDNPVKKIDYIFVSKDIKVIYAKVPDVISSDHRPIVAELDI